MPKAVTLIRSATLSTAAEYAYAATAPAEARLLFLAGSCPLNQDGSTYVQDKSRKDSTPTEEEVRFSEDLKKGHMKEIQEQSGQPVTPTPDTQGQVPSGERGMNAETGSNTAARALFALLVFSVFGGVAFVARRRFA